MTLSRFFCPELKSGQIELDQTETHHLVHVMRMGVGDAIELFDGKGGLGEAVIRKITRKAAIVEVSKVIGSGERGSRVIIAASVPKGQRFDWMISKCTELGVDHIWPVIFKRTVKLAKGASTIKRCKTLAITAAKQCKRLFLPEISEPCGLNGAIERLKEQYPKAELIFGGFGEKTISAREIMDFGTDIIVFVGPEGGMTADEEEILNKNGAKAVSITSTVLRIETAAVAFASIACASRDS